MATLTITIPDAVAPRVLDAFANNFNYDPVKDGTKAAFFKAKVVQLIRGVVVSYEAQVASSAAASKADEEIVPS